MKTFILKNEQLEVVLLDEFGGKLISIADHEGFEILYRNRDSEYRMPVYAAPFSEYDTSGLDECFPTIDESTVQGRHYPDHGDLWCVAWKNRIIEDGISSSVHSASSGLNFKREIRLDGNKILFHYQVNNPSSMPAYYLWAQHGLLRWDESAELILPFSDDELINVIDGEKYPFDFTRLTEYPDGDCFKFYNSRPLAEGRVDVIYPKTGRVFCMRFDPVKLPYIGVWVTKGGFKGDYNFALEPSNGFYDSAARAIANGLEPIEPNTTVDWTVQLQIQKEGKWRN